MEDRAPIESFKDLKVWQQAISLAERCYALTRSFPPDELFGLTAQIRRAAVSIPANIAEGHGRESTGSFVQFLRIAQGSLKELETHLILAQRVGMLDRSDAGRLEESYLEIGKMLRSLIRSLQRRT